MNTATIDTPTAPAAAGELIRHEFNEEGVCLNPETVKVPVPKGCECTILLGCDVSGSWRVGQVLQVGKEDQLAANVSDRGEPYATREAALKAGLEDARKFFEASPKGKLHRKCAGEVNAFLVGLGARRAAAPAKFAAKLPEPRTMDVPVARLEPSPHNPRGPVSPDDADVVELAATIADVGLLQPVGVRILSGPGGLPGLEAENRLELLWGHRRAAAHQRLKRETVSAKVYENISDDQARLLLLVENGQQKALDPIQEARGYAEMVRDFELTQDDVAKLVKKSRPVVANALRLLELPDSVQDLLRAGKLSQAHGTALCRFKDWPKVCAKIADLAVEEKASANSLEKNLPFGSDLVDAKLAVDFQWKIRPGDKRAKALKSDPSWFIWEDKDYYEDFAYCIDLERAKAMQTELEEEAKAHNARNQGKSSDESEDEDEGSSGSGLSAAEKRERQKKLDKNLTNRLQCAAMEHAALERLSMVNAIDAQCLLILCSEALKHDGGEIEEAAKRLGISLPKGFDDSHEWGYAGKDYALASLAKMKLHDALVLCAGALVMRDARDAMRYASGVPEFVHMGARPWPEEELDFAGYVADWHQKIVPLVKMGCRAEDVQGQLGCPEYIAVQLVRQIRRDLREANVPILSKEEAAVLERIGSAGVNEMLGEFRIQWSKSNSELAKIFDKTTASDVAAVRKLYEQQQAWEMACKPAAEEKPAKPKGKDKPAKKAAKKGGKKK